MGRSDARPTPPRAGLYWLPVIVMWAVPPLVAVGFWSVGQEAEDRAVRQPLPATIPVGERSTDYAQQATLNVTLAEPVPAVTTAVGRVTEVFVADGIEIQNGAVLLAVDGVSRRAYTLSVPFFRDLSVGDQGADVAQLDQYLVGLGYDTGAGDRTRFGPMLERAVKRFQTDIGASTDGVFRQDYVVFVPAGVEGIGDVEVRTGDFASGDLVVFSSAPAATGATIVGVGERSITGGDQPGPWRITVGDRVAEVDSLTIDAPTAQRLWRSLGPVPAVSDAGGLRAQLDATVSLATPLLLADVPAGAVYSSATGTTCVFVVHPSGSTNPSRTVATPVQVSVLPGDLTAIGVQADLAGEWVVADPHALARDQTIGCAP